MRKLAIFVEGQTERIFVEQFLIEAIGRERLKIISQSATGGGKSGSRQFKILGFAGATNAARVVMITDCGKDSHVRSDIQDNIVSLAHSGYETIIGIRDVFPTVQSAEVGRLRVGLRVGLPAKGPRIVFILGVMEIESWFLSEHTHFERLDSRLTQSHILSSLGFDPESGDMQLRPNPAADLHNAYQLVGKKYGKTAKDINRTVACLDFARLYIELPQRIQDLQTFVTEIETFYK